MPAIESSPGVYAIINTRNGMLYIGSSAIAIANRWKDHRKLLNKNKHHSRRLQNAWNKLGADCFAFKVVIVCEPGEALHYEQIVIDQHKSYHRNHGYNILPLAGRNAGYKHTDEAKRKISAAFKGRVFSAEAREKLRESNKKTWSMPRGKAHIAMLRERYALSQENMERVRRNQKAIAARPVSEETRKKQSDAAKRRYRNPEQKAAILEVLARARSVNPKCLKGQEQ